MVNLKRFILVILILSLILTVFAINSFATDINMNLAQEQNVTNGQNSINDVDSSSNNTLENSVETTNSTSSPSTNSNEEVTTNNTSLNTNTAATVQSVEQFEDNTASFDISNVINILLLAVGLVLILLAVAILIRLKK